MRTDSFSYEKFSKVPIVGIVRGMSMEEVSQILPRFREAGLTTIEITMNTPNAEGIIDYALSRYADTLNIGAGTVCNPDDLQKALRAGAQFIVTPIVEEQVISTCVIKQIPIFPGAYTPTEIYKAWNLGASLVKVFPATSLGTAYLKELKGPLGQIKLLPTGGINLVNCLEFLHTGAAGLGIGSQLFDKQMIVDRNWKGLLRHFEKFVKKINAYHEMLKSENKNQVQK